MKYLVKDIQDAVKDVDSKQGIITGYFSVFGNVDSDGDIILPGAYKKSIQENGPESKHPRILHLYQHDPWQVLSKPHVLKEDERGLYFESKISLTTLGRDVLKLYEDGVITEHSVGFQIIKREVDEEQEVQKLTELKLWEGSSVSWGANMEALVSEVKSDTDTLERVIKKLDAVTKAYRDGNYSDDTHRQIEIQMKQLEQLIVSLARKPKESLPPPEPKLTAEQIIKMLNLKNL